MCISIVKYSYRKKKRREKLYIRNVITYAYNDIIYVEYEMNSKEKKIIIIM